MEARIEQVEGQIRISFILQGDDGTYNDIDMKIMNMNIRTDVKYVIWIWMLKMEYEYEY